MKKIIPILGVLFILTVFIAFRISQIPVKPIHYHANFAVFSDGMQIDFSKPEFMHITPCMNTDTISLDPKENVHLHDLIGNVVHVHAPGITWKTFFQTVKYWDIIKSATDSAVYVDGKPALATALEEPIRDQTHLLIVMGSASSKLQIESAAVGTTAIDYDTGKKGVEQCGATGNRSLWQRFQIAFHLI